MKILSIHSGLVLVISFTIYMIFFVNQYYVFDNLLGYRNGTMFLTGDEPHYILITQNLIENHSFFMEKIYGKPYSDMLFAIGTGWHATYFKGHYVPNHGIGLPLLIAIPYAFGGTFLAISVIVFLSALVNVVVYKTCNHFVNKRISFVTSMIFGFGTLLFPYSNQVYPDVIMGLITLSVLYLIFFQNLSRRTVSLVGALLAFGILLKITFLLVVIILTPIVIMEIIRKKKVSTIPILFLGAMPFVLLFMWFNNSSFGSPLSYPSYCSSCNGDPLVGLSLLFFDRYGGMLTFSPILILLFYGLPSAYKKNTRYAISLILICFLWALLNAINKGVGWGEDLPARYLITIMPLFTIPFACALERYYKNPLFLGATILFTFIGTVLSSAIAYDRWTGLASANTSGKSQLLNLVYRGVEKIFPALYGKEFGTYNWSTATWYNMVYVAVLMIIMFFPIGLALINKFNGKLSKTTIKE